MGIIIVQNANFIASSPAGIIGPMITGKQIALNAHLLSGEAGYRSAGIHGYIYQSLAHLPAAAPETDFTLFTGHGAVPDSFAKSCIKRSRWDTARAPFRISWEQTALPLLLAKTAPDLLHGMAFSLPLFWRGLSTVTIYDLSFKAYPERLSPSRREYLERITAYSARQARRIITISDFSRQEIAREFRLDEAVIDLAYPGVTMAFSPLSKEKIASFRDEKGLPSRFVLYLGTLEPRKNLTMLLQAYAHSEFRGDVKLVLAGGIGWMAQPILEAIKELNLTNDVLLPGYVPNEEIALWYNAAEVFVYPSLYEGFGMPIIEAMACGTPVIASQATSHPEAAGQAGYLLPADDPEIWSKAMAQVLSDKKKQANMTQKGLEHSRDFSWKNTAVSIIDSYTKSLASTG